MKRFNGDRSQFDQQLDRFFDNVIAKSQEPKLKSSIFRLVAQIVEHPVIGYSMIFDKLTNS